MAGHRAIDRAWAQDGGLLEKRESLYNNIFIFGDKDTVTMTFGQNKRYFTESIMSLSDPGALVMEYARYMTVGVAYVPKAERILEVGLGGGSVASYLSAALPGAEVVIHVEPIEEPGSHRRRRDAGRERRVDRQGARLHQGLSAGVE